MVQGTIQCYVSEYTTVRGECCATRIIRALFTSLSFRLTSALYQDCLVSTTPYPSHFLRHSCSPPLDTTRDLEYNPPLEQAASIVQTVLGEGTVVLWCWRRRFV